MKTCEEMKDLRNARYDEFLAYIERKILNGLTKGFIFIDEDGVSEVVLVVGPKKVVLQNFTVDDKWKLPMKVTHWMPLPELPEEE